jgi:hypothetical protein
MTGDERSGGQAGRPDVPWYTPGYVEPGEPSAVVPAQDGPGRVAIIVASLCYLPGFVLYVAGVVSGGATPGSAMTLPALCFGLAGFFGTPVMFAVAVAALFAKRRKRLVVAALMILPASLYLVISVALFLQTDWFHT